MTGMAALCLVLGIMAAMGGTWLIPDEDKQKEMETYGVDYRVSLTSSVTESDMTVDPAITSEAECEVAAKGMEEQFGAEAECDGTVMTMTMVFSDVCDKTEDEDACDMASAGMVGTIGMWAGVLCALLVALTLILPMAGVDAMDAMPDMGKMITSWGAGALMLVGILGWWMMLPEGGEMTMGMSSMMAIAAALLGLAAAAMDQFMDADE